MRDMSGRTTIVVGASRGLGRGIAAALADAGSSVVAIARTAVEHTAPASGAGQVRAEVVDAADGKSATELIARHEPHALVVVAGAVPVMRPLQDQDWESFSVNWETDVRITFDWLREALTAPLRPGGRVVVVSSGAALNADGSPLSGGYAGAKAMQRFLTGYAQGEADRAGLDLSFTAVLPRFAPETGVGSAAVAAYAERAGAPVKAFLEHHKPLLTPEIAGRAAVGLLSAGTVAPAYLLSGAGLRELR